MTDDRTKGEPDSTAVRVALWRALHLAVDAPPHVFTDDIGLRLAAPPAGWEARPDMHPEGTRAFRASIVARARFVEDLLAEEIARGVTQYVVLGAGLDTFVQRKPELAARLRVFEIDRAGPQAWKRRRLAELGYAASEGLRFVPVDFEAGQSWRAELLAAGFDPAQPALVSSLGVSMYLSREANAQALRDVASFAPGTTLVLSFLLPFERAAPDVRVGLERSAAGARASGTPFVSFFEPDEVLGMARAAGLRDASHVSAKSLGERYFSGRADGLRPPENGEELLVART